MDLKLKGLDIFYPLIILSLLITQTVGDSLQAVDDSEFSKLIKDEKYVVALFCASGQEERCEEQCSLSCECGLFFLLFG